MKKVLSILSIALLSASVALAGGYKISDTEVDAMFASADDVTTQVLVDQNELLSANFVDVKGITADVTVGGFLLRSFFCGFIAMHRGYAGNGGTALWWWYLCIPVLGGFTNFVDFWGVLFCGETQLSKYKGSSDLMVFFAK